MQTYPLPQGTISVINDGLKYQYGTKERIIKSYIQERMKEGFSEFVYAGPVNAMGAFALAKGCIEAGAYCTLFLCGQYLPAQAKQFPSSVKINLIHDNLYAVSEKANNYAQEPVSRFKRFCVPFGINDTLYKSLLKSSIEQDEIVKGLSPKRMWLAVGSGTILSILLELFPATEFHAVQVGKSLKVETLSEDPAVVESYRQRIKIYWSPEKFTQSANILPPYSSLANYDAKVWQFVLKEGQDGDIIWNVV